MLLWAAVSSNPLPLTENTAFHGFYIFVRRKVVEFYSWSIYILSHCH